MKLREIVLQMILAIAGIVMLTPFAWMISLSFKTEQDILTSQLRVFPPTWDFANYAQSWTDGHIGTFLLNGAIVTLSILALQYLTIIPAAYVLARKQFRLNGFLFATVLAVLLVPQQVTAIPVYLLLGKLGLINTRAALIVPFATSAFGIFLLRQTFKSFPQELIDAARVDGASESYTLWNILVPLSLPTLAAFGIFSIIVHWNDLFWPLLVVYDLGKSTPPLGISIFAADTDGGSLEIGPMMASATLIVLPLCLTFLATRRRFIEGIAMTGLKR
ncbi:MAG: carbohydrate ABC transporter permease [Cyanobacteria bacterium P01_A01_bin.3]